VYEFAATDLNVYRFFDAYIKFLSGVCSCTDLTCQRWFAYRYALLYTLEGCAVYVQYGGQRHFSPYIFFEQ
jgi:hypothetical protein